MASTKLEVVITAKDRASRVIKGIGGSFAAMSNDIANKAASIVTSLSRVTSAMAKMAAKKSFAGVKAGISGLANTIRTTAKGIALGAAGIATSIAGIGIGLGKLAIDAAPLEQARNAFQGFTRQMGTDADTFLAGSKAMSNGLLSQREIMFSVNKAAQLVSLDFAEKLPQAFGMLQKVSASTGQDMNFLVDSLVTGVGRMSPQILDNLGIQIKLGNVTERAAEMFGVEAEQLTQAQQQAALMNLVLEKLAANTAAIPDSAGSAADIIGQFRARMQDFKDTIGTALLPAFTELASRAIPMVEGAMVRLQSAGRMVGPFVKALLSIGNLRSTEQLEAMQRAIDNFSLALRQLGVPLETILQIREFLMRAVESFREFRSTLDDTLPGVAAMTEEAFARIKAALGIQEDISKIDVAIGILDGVFSAAITAVQGFGVAMQLVADAVERFVSLKAQVEEMVNLLSGLSLGQGVESIATTLSGGNEGVGTFARGASEAFSAIGDPFGFLRERGGIQSGSSPFGLGGVPLALPGGGSSNLTFQGTVEIDGQALGNVLGTTQGNTSRQVRGVGGPATQ